MLSEQVGRVDKPIASALRILVCALFQMHIARCFVAHSLVEVWLLLHITRHLSRKSQSMHFASAPHRAHVAIGGVLIGCFI